MNMNQRKRVEVIYETLVSMQGELQILADEENEKLNNLPDSLLESQVAWDMDQALDALINASNCVYDAFDNLRELF